MPSTKRINKNSFFLLKLLHHGILLLLTYTCYTSCSNLPHLKLDMDPDRAQSPLRNINGSKSSSSPLTRNRSTVTIEQLVDRCAEVVSPTDSGSVFTKIEQIKNNFVKNLTQKEINTMLQVIKYGLRNPSEKYRIGLHRRGIKGSILLACLTEALYDTYTLKTVKFRKAYRSLRYKIAISKICNFNNCYIKNDKCRWDTVNVHDMIELLQLLNLNKERTTSTCTIMDRASKRNVNPFITKIFSNITFHSLPTPTCIELCKIWEAVVSPNEPEPELLKLLRNLTNNHIRASDTLSKLYWAQ